MRFQTYELFAHHIKLLIPSETLAAQMSEYALIMRRSFEIVQIGLTTEDNKIILSVFDKTGRLVSTKEYKNVVLNTRNRRIMDIELALVSLGHSTEPGIVKAILELNDMLKMNNERVGIIDLDQIENLIIKSKK